MPVCRISGPYAFEPITPKWLDNYLDHERLQNLHEAYGSPLNLNNLDTFGDNVKELKGIFTDLNVPLKPYFARKANKCIGYIQESRKQGIGIDVASYQELEQAVRANLRGNDIVCSAAVKNDDLLQLCLESDAIIAVDDIDELERIQTLAKERKVFGKICLRLSGFSFQGKNNSSRFGFPISDLIILLGKLASYSCYDNVICSGLHFHITGYNAYDRHLALSEILRELKQNSELCKTLQFIDIGGGLPVQYVDETSSWMPFWAAVKSERAGNKETQVLFNDRPAFPGCSEKNVYPVTQYAASRHWFSELFGANTQNDLRRIISDLELSIHCEPGRWLLKDCGATIARVATIKTDTFGRLCIFLEMNHTQCRTGSEEFLVDPILVSSSNTHDASKLTEKPHSHVWNEEERASIYGAYCTETDLIFNRTFIPPDNIRAGDFLVIPNTAGYFMHFRESRSHQLPLAANLLVSTELNTTVRDMIDFERNVGGALVR